MMSFNWGEFVKITIISFGMGVIGTDGNWFVIVLFSLFAGFIMGQEKTKH